MSTMENILLATDLKASSAHTLDRAILLAHTSGAKLHILHVASAFHHPGLKDEAENSKKDKVQKIQNAIAGNIHAKNLDISIHIASGGRVDDRIIEYSDELAQCLIVMGTHQEIEYISSVVSTTLERVIFTVRFPVLLVVEEVTHQYENILLGPKLSRAPDATIRVLAKFCTRINLTLLLKGDNTSSFRSSRIGKIVSHLKSKIQKKFISDIERLLEQSHPSDNVVKPKYVDEISVDTIRKEAQKANADLIALDMRGHIAPRHLKVDGLVGKLIKLPPCDILIMQ